MSLPAFASTQRPAALSVSCHKAVKQFSKHAFYPHTHVYCVSLKPTASTSISSCVPWLEVPNNFNRCEQRNILVIKMHWFKIKKIHDRKTTFPTASKKICHITLLLHEECDKGTPAQGYELSAGHTSPPQH